MTNKLKEAFEAARHAYQRMSNGKGPVRAVTEDKKVQRDLRTAAESLRDASDRLRGRAKQRRWGRLILIGLMAGGFIKYGYLAAQYTIGQGVVTMRVRATAIAVLLFVVNLLGYGLGPLFAGFVSVGRLCARASRVPSGSMVTPAV